MTDVECPNPDCDREYYRSVFAQHIACPCGVIFHQETGETVSKKKNDISTMGKIKSLVLGK